MSLFRVNVEDKENLDPLGLLDNLWVPNAAWLTANGQAGCVCIYSPRNISQMMIVSFCLGRPRRAGATWADGKTRSQSKCIICIMIWLWFQSKNLPYFTFIMQITEESKRPCVKRDGGPKVASDFSDVSFLGSAYLTYILTAKWNIYIYIFLIKGFQFFLASLVNCFLF